MREILEALLAAQFTRTLNKLLKHVLRQAQDGIVEMDEAYWNRQLDKLQARIFPILADAYNRGAAESVQNTTEKAISFDFDPLLVEINEEALEWAREFSASWLPAYLTLRREVVGDAIANFITDPEFTLQNVEDSLAQYFDPERAALTARTEITRAWAQGHERISERLRQDGLVFVDVWNTRRDDLVCPICGPRHNTERGTAWNDSPPAHPGCRCGLSRRVEEEPEIIL